jgi:GDPmannose 4,6-dehydratase
MWRMLQHDVPDDYCVATGISHSLRDLLKMAFGALDLDWKQYVEIDPRYYRPAEVDHLEGDPSKARKILGWEPKTDLARLVDMMVESDMRLAERELVLRESGHAEVPRIGYR